MKYLITGVTGSGKSTIAGELRNRGRVVYDTDSENLARWEDDEGKPAPSEHHPSEEWLKHHHWNINEDKLQKILKDHENIGLCGTASNLKNFFSLFDKIFVLVIDQPELAERLNNRTNNPFGKSAEEQADIFSWHKWYEESLIKQGAQTIDATLPLNEVVELILKDSDDNN